MNLPYIPIETGYESYGEVVSIGENVRKLKVGDRVIAFYGHKDFNIVKENEIILVPKDINCRDALLTILS
ncbi:alcohol dehydrogenase catalytic domain-containing protein [Bacillus sp. J14TS2]|uniref:alcohol dehydrogenase catalytic domain-containing protein n=1 Tax=Bacillus sp. J14TS2 TaxID=2807188 RepID=UPI0027954D7F|nr:alcohol dehydrogenase catalytic domain-containing protein [Bacillus sp. J14TS2]